MIEPTVGRVVWYHHNHEASPYPKLGDQPFAAHVAFVHSDRLVNLLVISHTGQTYPRESVILRQEGDGIPQDAPYAEWMPYQKGQAAKAEAAEAAAKTGAAQSALVPQTASQQPAPTPEPEAAPANPPSPAPAGGAPQANPASIVAPPPQAEGATA